MFKSIRGVALLYEGIPSKLTLCAEDYSKWYSLFCVYPSGAISEVSFNEIEADYLGEDSAYCDHVPNPMAVCCYAAKHNMDICSKSLAAITRRWYNEYYNYEYYLEHSDNSNEH